MASISHRGRVPFVGRREELQRLLQLRQRLEGNNERGRHLVLIEGFSGVGKTALAEEFLAVLERDGRSFTARGAYNSHVHRPPLAPLLDAVDDLFSGAFAQRRLHSLFADVTYYPLLASLPILRGTIGIDLHGMKPGASSSSTIAALIGSVLTHSARFRPVVLLLDDVHCIPDEDLEALVTLNAGLRNVPVLLVGTMHRDAPGADRIRERLAPALLDHFHLSPLPTNEVAELVTEMYGARISAQIAADIAHAGEGVPMKTVELIRFMESQNLLMTDERGGWRLGSGYNAKVLGQDYSSIDKVRRLNPREQRILLLLGCAGGYARRDELADWFAAIEKEYPGTEPPASEQDIAELIESLEQNLLIKPVMANPDMVTFAHGSIRDAQWQVRSPEDCESVARLIITRLEMRSRPFRWTYDPELFQSLLRVLPSAGSPERTEIMNTLIDTESLFSAGWEHAHRAEVYGMMRANRDLLTTFEYANVLVQMILLDHYFTRFAEAVEKAEELHRLASEDPSCGDLRAESCMLLAFARFYNDRSSDIADLLHEASEALVRIGDTRRRMRTELQMARMRTALVPVNEPQEAIARAKRVLHLAEMLGLQEEKYNVLPELVVRSARLRDEEQLRYYCNELLSVIRSSASSGAALPPFHVISGVVRATLIYGDIFLARQIFESWSRCSAPIEIADYIAYSYLTTLFAIADGEPSLAADTALAAREEVLRHRAAARHVSWEFTFNYAILQVQLVPSLIAAGRYFEALALTETMIEEMVPFESRLPDMMTVLRLYGAWLRWRCMLPVDAPVNFCWPRAPKSLEAGASSQSTGYDPESMRTAAEEFRAFHAGMSSQVAPPPRFIAETLLAGLESAEGNYAQALAAIERAGVACEQLYDWQRELEYRASAITIRLRAAESAGTDSARFVEEAVESARELFTRMSEKGLAARIAQLAGVFHEVAAGITGSQHRDLPAQFEKLGATAQAAAHVVVRNSRSQESGPIERARLFLMGPFRLMRPHSYMELSETAFGRETARTLLVSLVAAEVLERGLTREELASQIVPKARTPEQQKKALYNAASAARAACSSTGSILNVGANSLELNINPDLEGSVWVDALELKRAARRGEELERSGEIGAALDEYQRALLLARKGEFATDIYADWVDAARDRLREMIRDASLAVARITLRRGLYAAGIEAMTTQLTRDHFDEEAHRALIRLYNESGNRSAALKQIEKCRKLIKREFGVDLEPETLRLRQEILGMAEVEGSAGVRR